MKKSISISGIACANLMMFGSMFKVMHWPGASVMLILAVFLFCFVFLPMALINNYQRQEEKKYFALHVTTFFVFFLGMMGILFKVMHWPGSGFFLLAGIPLPFVVFLPVYLYQTRNEKKNTLNYSGIMFGLIFLAVFSVLLALNVSRWVLENSALKIGDNDRFSTYNSAKLKNVVTDNKIKKEADELVDFIGDLKCQLFTATQNNFCESKNGAFSYNPEFINQKDNTQASVKILFGEGTDNAVRKLKQKINSYKETLLDSGKMSPELRELINDLFDVSDRKSDEDEQMLSWEEKEFRARQLVFVLDVLSQIESNVRLVESEVLASK
jgi:hypothetical protein